MSIEQYILNQYDGGSDWFVKEVALYNNQERVVTVNGVKEYLSGSHAILNRPNETYNGTEFKTRKIILQYAKNVLNFSTSYLLSTPVTLSGNDKAVAEYKKVYKQGKYNRIDFDILDKMTKYGDVYEYVFIDSDKKIQSKIINSECGFPVYDDHGSYIAFIEYYSSDSSKVSYYYVYYVDRVDTFNDKGGELIFVKSAANISGLPIVYKNKNELDETCH